MMYAIKINNRLVRDDKGCVYRYSSKLVAEAKAKLMFGKLFKADYKVINYESKNQETK